MHRSHMLVLIGVFLVLVAVFAFGFLFTPQATGPVEVRVVPADDVDWQLLNPLRGDASPRAGTLWGDRGAPVPCGFLVKFVDGFSSPPHIHPVTYRGVAINGLVHNDVPDAPEVWLPPGSFWTQPAGEVHITAAKGEKNIAYIEIEKGPYLVHPADQAFERPETPIKLAPGDMTWKDATGGAKGAQVCALAGNPGDETIQRMLLKLPAGFNGVVRTDGSTFHAVVVEGAPTHEVEGETEPTMLEAGSYFGSDGYVEHQVRVGADAPCLVYVRTLGAIAVVDG